MKHIFISLLYIIASVISIYARVNIGIIPAPYNVELGNKIVNLPNIVYYETNLSFQEIRDIEDWMQMMEGKLSPFKFIRTDIKNRAFLVLEKDNKDIPESYELVINEKRIIVKASDVAGFFYSLQSLCQVANHYSMKIPVMTIKDKPRFSYRGILMDPARNFMTTQFIKKQMDMMAYFKINHLHLHLTDDSGWRIEIKKYPDLTNKTSYYPYENHEKWWLGGMKFCSRKDSASVGGFYSQNDIIDLVEYARKLNITIVPEVDIPGHSGALTYSYPELTCKECPSNVLCPGNEYVYEFMENIFIEIMDLFPSKLIHVGCDEVSKDMWRNCSLCKEKMRNENISELEGLQSYMMRRFDRFFVKHGRNMIGWDEMLQGGLAENSVVMSWRGIDGGIQAAQQGKKSIMCPERYCYLDGFQDDPTGLGISSGWYLPISDVYSYNPAPDYLEENVAKEIIGVQGNLWNSWLYLDDEIETFLWPRAMAIAEIGWTFDEYKDYDKFRLNALELIEKMHEMGYSSFDLKKEKGERNGFYNQVNSIAIGKILIDKNNQSDYKKVVDGYIGGWRLDPDRWFLSERNKDFIIDLNENKKIEYIGITSIQARGYRIPTNVQFYISDDNVEYKLLHSFDNNIEYIEPIGYYYNNYIDNSWKGDCSTQYIKIRINSDKKWGIDEIVIR